jgi:hypothetical protein
MGKIDLAQYYVVYCIQLSHYRIQGQTLVKTLKNLLV